MVTILGMGDLEKKISCFARFHSKMSKNLKKWAHLAVVSDGDNFRCGWPCSNFEKSERTLEWKIRHLEKISKKKWADPRMENSTLRKNFEKSERTLEWISRTL